MSSNMNDDDGKRVVDIGGTSDIHQYRRCYHCERSHGPVHIQAAVPSRWKSELEIQPLIVQSLIRKTDNSDHWSIQRHGQSSGKAIG
jgi:hypothetical protein